jgi:hypothetical protein
MMFRHVHAIVATTLALGMLGAGPQQARACTYGYHVRLVEVAGPDGFAPTNVVPLLVGYFPPDAEYVLRPAGGDPIATAAQEHLGPAPRGIVAVDVIPESPLSPDTDYELAIVTEYEIAVVVGTSGPWTFHTGPGPLATSPPSPPRDLRFQVLDEFPSRSSCGSGHVCFPALGDRTVEATVRLPDGTVEGVTIMRDPFDGFVRTPWSFESPFCLELRSRDIAGRRSEPAVVCSEDVTGWCGLHTSASCDQDGTYVGVDLVPREVCTTDAGVPGDGVDAGTGSGEVPVPGGGGCSVPDHRASAVWVWLGAIGVAASVSASRRSRGRWSRGGGRARRGRRRG